MKKLTATFLASLALLSGCATSTLNIDPTTNSTALQIARAANLKQVDDKKIPKAEFDRLVDSPIYNAAWSSAMYFNPAMGFSSGSSLALALPALLFSNKPADSYSQILAWMPQELAENPNEALKKMDSIFLEAMTQTFDDLGHPKRLTRSLKSMSRSVTFISIEDEKLKCDPKNAESLCMLYNRIYPPKLVSSPLLVGDGAPSYFFPLPQNNTIGFDVREDYKPFDELEVLTTYSKYLPTWAYLYVAPKTISDIHGDLIQYPFILHQGKTLLFLKPEDPNRP